MRLYSVFVLVFLIFLFGEIVGTVAPLVAYQFTFLFITGFGGGLMALGLAIWVTDEKK